MTDSPADSPAHYTKAQRRLLTAVGGLGVAVLAGAAFVLSYDDLRTLAIRGGAVRHRAFLYPGIVNGLVVVVILSILAARRASWWSRAVRWLLLLLLIAGAGAAGVERAINGYRSLPHDWVSGGVAAAPWAVLLIAVWLWTAMIKQVLRARRDRPAARSGRVRSASSPPDETAGRAAGTVMDGDIVPGFARAETLDVRPLSRPATVREPGPARPQAVVQASTGPGRAFRGDDGTGTGPTAGAPPPGGPATPPARERETQPPGRRADGRAPVPGDAGATAAYGRPAAVRAAVAHEDGEPDTGVTTYDAVQTRAAAAADDAVRADPGTGASDAVAPRAGVDREPVPASGGHPADGTPEAGRAGGPAGRPEKRPDGGVDGADRDGAPGGYADDGTYDDAERVTGDEDVPAPSVTGPAHSSGRPAPRPPRHDPRRPLLADGRPASLWDSAPRPLPGAEPEATAPMDDDAAPAPSAAPSGTDALVQDPAEEGVADDAASPDAPPRSGPASHDPGPSAHAPQDHALQASAPPDPALNASAPQSPAPRDPAGPGPAGSGADGGEPTGRTAGPARPGGETGEDAERDVAEDIEATAPRMVARPSLPTDVRLVGPPSPAKLADTQPDGIKLPDTDPVGIKLPDTDPDGIGAPGVFGRAAAGPRAEGAVAEGGATEDSAAEDTAAGAASQAAAGADADTDEDWLFESDADQDAGDRADGDGVPPAQREPGAGEPPADEDPGEAAADGDAAERAAGVAGEPGTGTGGTGQDPGPPPPSGTFRSSPTPPRRRG